MSEIKTEFKNIKKESKFNLVKSDISHTERKDKDKEKREAKKLKLTDNEYALLKIAEYEYNDLFPEILNKDKEAFFSSLQRYILIHLSPKNIIFPTGTIDKILKIIDMNYYINDYKNILNLLNHTSKSKSAKFLYFNGHNFLSHCSKTKEALHPCGNKLQLIDKGRYLYCQNCNLVYYYRNVLLYCENCRKEYYTEIKEINSIQKYCLENNLKQATWAKYHCNAIMNDTMKCQNCSNVLYINKNNKLICLNCKYEIEQYDIKWNCMICYQDFVSEAKEYDPFIFKIIKMTVKQTLFKGVEAKPPCSPCCNISNDQIGNYKFFHKKECNGLLYEGEMDGKKIVVCSKCHMLNYYKHHYWLCPICKKRYKISNEYNHLDSLDTNKIKNEKHNEIKSSIQLKEKKRSYQNSLLNKYGLNKFALRDEFKNVYKTNDDKEGEGNDKVEEKLHNKKLIQGICNNNNINRRICSQKDNHKFFKLEKNIENDLVIKSISPLKQLEIKVNRNECGSDESKKNVRVNSFKQAGGLFLKNKNLKKSDKNFYYESNNIYKNLDESSNNSKSKNLEGNITSPFNLGKQSQLVSNNININVNLNLNINNNNDKSSNIDLTPRKMRQRMNSAKDIKIKKHNSPRRTFFKKNSIDIVTNNLNINDYNIIKQIGEGTFGKIFEVENSRHEHFALKKLLANSIREMEMLKSEYELLLGLDDLNINLIKIYGIENKKLDKTTFVVYVLMELAVCDWEKEISRRDKIKKYYTEKELINILRNLISTFAVLQRNNISHRDIKPQNILLCNDNILKIADFGEAKEERNKNMDTINQTIRGTELYMSPILFNSLKKKKRNGKYILHNSYKSDVFSLGFCILLAATLKIDSLYVIREIQDMDLMSKKVYSFLKKRYSDKLIDVIISMLEIDEKNRVDFIELEKIIDNL